eukprot:5902491-Pyramimonas_sp.AAC.1
MAEHQKRKGGEGGGVSNTETARCAYINILIYVYWGNSYTEGGTMRGGWDIQLESAVHHR